MAGLLISGPAGAGKSQRARQALADTPEPAVVIEFQELYAALLGIRRLPSGRYPERLDSDAYALPLTEYLRRAAITSARERDITPIVTNSDGLQERRTALLGYLGPGSREIVVDPGLAVVEANLALSPLSIRMGLEQKGQGSVGTSYLPPDGCRNLWQVYVGIPSGQRHPVGS